jgi:hypothetical protein
MPQPTIQRTITELATIELDQDNLELAIAFWLMNTYPEAFRGVSFIKFDWDIGILARVTVSGERINV